MQALIRNDLLGSTYHLRLPVCLTRTQNVSRKDSGKVEFGFVTFMLISLDPCLDSRCFFRRHESKASEAVSPANNILAKGGGGIGISRILAG